MFNESNFQKSDFIDNHNYIEVDSLKEENSQNENLQEKCIFKANISFTDHYLSIPNPYMDQQHLIIQSKQSEDNPLVTKVPVIRLFGRTNFGQSVCIHVHRVFPYFYIPYLGPIDFLPMENMKDNCHQSFYPKAYSENVDLDSSSSQFHSSQDYISSLAYSLNKALFVFESIKLKRHKRGKNKQPEVFINSFSQNSHSQTNYTQDTIMPTYIASIQIVNAIPFYGFFPGYQYFLKISLLNPSHIERAMHMLRSGVIFSTKFNCFEGQLQYMNQFMIDYNLYGMSDILLSDCRFRLPIKEPLAEFMTESVNYNRDINTNFKSFNTQGYSLPSSAGFFNANSDPKFPLGAEMLTNSNVPANFSWPSSFEIEKTTFADIEIDIWEFDILNSNNIKERALTPLPRKLPFYQSVNNMSDDDDDDELQVVPSLAEIWKSEKLRREHYGINDDLKKGTFVRTVDSSGFFENKAYNQWQYDDVNSTLLEHKFEKLKMLLLSEPKGKFIEEKIRHLFQSNIYNQSNILTSFKAIRPWLFEDKDDNESKKSQQSRASDKVSIPLNNSFSQSFIRMSPDAITSNQENRESFLDDVQLKDSQKSNNAENNNKLSQFSFFSEKSLTLSNKLKSDENNINNIALSQSIMESFIEERVYEFASIDNNQSDIRLVDVDTNVSNNELENDSNTDYVSQRDKLLSITLDNIKDEPQYENVYSQIKSSVDNILFVKDTNINDKSTILDGIDNINEPNELFSDQDDVYEFNQQQMDPADDIIVESLYNSFDESLNVKILNAIQTLKAGDSVFNHVNSDNDDNISVDTADNSETDDILDDDYDGLTDFSVDDVEKALRTPNGKDNESHELSDNEPLSDYLNNHMVEKDVLEDFDYLIQQNDGLSDDKPVKRKTLGLRRRNSKIIITPVIPGDVEDLRLENDESIISPDNSFSKGYIKNNNKSKIDVLLPNRKRSLESNEIEVDEISFFNEDKSLTISNFGQVSPILNKTVDHININREVTSIGSLDVLKSDNVSSSNDLLQKRIFTLGKGPSLKHANVEPEVLEIKPYFSNLNDIPTSFDKDSTYEMFNQLNSNSLSVNNLDPLKINLNSSTMKEFLVNANYIPISVNIGSSIASNTLYLGRKSWTLSKLPPSSKDLLYDVKLKNKNIENNSSVSTQKDENEMKDNINTEFNNTLISQISGPTLKNKFGFKLTDALIDSLDKKNEIENHNGVVILSMELFSNSKTNYCPDPKKDSIQLLTYCLKQEGRITSAPGIGLSSNGSRAGYHTGMILVNNSSFKFTDKDSYFFPRNPSFDECSNYPPELIKYRKLLLKNHSNISLEITKDEETLIERFISRIRTNFDPDLLVGYKIHRDSWGYLIERSMFVYGIDLCNELSRSISALSKSNFSVKNRDVLRQKNNSNVININDSQDSLTNEGIGIDIERILSRTQAYISTTGRKFLNIWRLLRNELNLTSYSFENMYFHVLHKRIPKFSNDSLKSWYFSKNNHGTYRTIDYILKKVEGNIHILDDTSLITRTSEFSSLFGVDFYSTLTRGSQYRVESIITRILKPENLLLFTPSKTNVANQRANDAIPLIIEPDPALYTSPVLVLDFQSLYPSIMIAYNYCFSTCLGRISDIQEEKNKESTLGAFPNIYFPPELVYALKDYIHTSPNGIIFLKREIREGILGKMLSEVLETRIMIKASMKKYKDKPALLRLLNAKQKGLKYLANVTYGFCGATYTGRMSCVEVADSIVQTAKETLSNTMTMIENHPSWKAKVVYGDTDSIFVKLEGSTMKNAFRVGKEIVEMVSKINPAPVTLKFEKVYSSSFILSKKRYAGMAYETYQDYIKGNSIFDAKGIETVRRDGCRATSKIMEQCLKIMFSYRDISLVKSYLLKQINKMVLNKIPIEEFIIAKEVILGSYSKISSIPPGARLIMKKILKDPRLEPDSKERIPFIIIQDKEKTRISDCSVSPLDYTLNNENHHMKINYKYYIYKHILPSLNRIFFIFGVDVFSWVNNLNYNLINNNKDVDSDENDSNSENDELEYKGMDKKTNEIGFKKSMKSLYIKSSLNVPINNNDYNEEINIDSNKNNKGKGIKVKTMESFIFIQGCIICKRKINSKDLKSAQRQYNIIQSMLKNEDSYKTNIEYDLNDSTYSNMKSTNKFICKECFQTPSLIISRLGYKLQEKMRIKKHYDKTCKECCNSSSKHQNTRNSNSIISIFDNTLKEPFKMCESIDCPVFYKQQQISRSVYNLYKSLTHLNMA